MVSEIFFSLLAKKLMDRHFFYCYWLKIDSEKIALPGERSQTMKPGLQLFLNICFFFVVIDRSSKIVYTNAAIVESCTIIAECDEKPLNKTSFPITNSTGCEIGNFLWRHKNRRKCIGKRGHDVTDG